MSSTDKKCPQCGLWNTENALECDCGYNFETHSNTPSSHQSATRQQRDLAKTKMKIENGINIGISGFFWISGLSLLNSIITLTGNSWRFLFGLGITQLVDDFFIEMAIQRGSNATLIKLMAFVVAFGIATLFGVFGMLAKRRNKWAFVVGMALYALDGLFLLLACEYLGLAFHAFMFFGLLTGLRMIGLAEALERGGNLYTVKQQMSPNRSPGKAFQVVFWTLIAMIVISFAAFVIGFLLIY